MLEWTTAGDGRRLGVNSEEVVHPG
jgi:hypothetical protein